MVSSQTQRVLVVGPGYFGRLLIAELLEFTACDIIIAGRHEARLRKLCAAFNQPGADRLTHRLLDLRSAETVLPALQGVHVAICTAGPFQDLPTTLPQLCLQSRVPYIDLADDRRFVGAVRKMPADAPAPGDLPPVCCGWSTLPALSAVLARRRPTDCRRSRRSIYRSHRATACRGRRAPSVRCCTRWGNPSQSGATAPHISSADGPSLAPSISRRQSAGAPAIS